MPRSDETEWWVNEVYEVIKKIPRGRITTYKHIAKLLETPQRARQVGTCLWNLRPANTSSASGQGEIEEGVIPFHNLESVPWQRVINSKGSISHR
ncbi:hypothetical protein N7504_007185 [Penicillium tannophilum]|nr:hypothetical protein N7504_007185 [Penicillium tannophilum]